MMTTKLLRSFLRIIILYFSLSSLPQLCKAQECTPIYHKTYNGIGSDDSHDIIKTSDGGSVVSGRTTSNSESYDGFLLKLKEDGTILWSRTFGGNEYDDLTKVIQTSDGGFVAMGNTKSFGQSYSVPWFMKTDREGNVQWSHIIKQDKPTKAKHIIQLNDGGFVLAYNVNDSTPQSDGFVTRTNAIGTPIWTKKFDQGNDDGINYILQDGSSLIISGYSSDTYRTGILMKVNINDGTSIWTRSFRRRLELHNEVINIDKTATGLAFGVISYSPSEMYYASHVLTMFKMSNDGEIYFQRNAQATTNTGRRIETIQLKQTADSGFAYILTDISDRGYGSMKNVSPSGSMEWGRQPNLYGSQRIRSLDVYGDRGYLMTGTINSFQTGNRDRIQVMKTDEIGATGSCTGNLTPNHMDSTNFIIQTLTWSLSNNITVNEEAVTPKAVNLHLSVETFCEQTDCRKIEPATGTSCYAGFITHYTEKYSFTPYDVTKVDDGYIVVGYNSFFWSDEPMVMKLRLDGTVQWSKTLNPYIHAGTFRQVLKTSDGNILIVGVYDRSINHSSADGSTLIKITPAGEVVWSRSIADGKIQEIHPAENGNYVGAIIMRHGTTDIRLFTINSLGKLVFQAQMQTQVNNYNLPNYRSVVYDGGFIYAAGELIHTNNKNSIQIDKFNTTGSIIWSKRFQVENEHTTVSSIQVLGDSLYIMSNVKTPSSRFADKINLGVVVISKAGSGIRGFTLTKPDLILDWMGYPYQHSHFRKVTKTNDGNFVVANRTFSDTDSTVILTKFTIGGKVLWSKRYNNLKNQFISAVHDDNGSLLILGQTYRGILDQRHMFYPMLMRTNVNGEVIKDGTGDCHFIDFIGETKISNITDIPVSNFYTKSSDLIETTNSVIQREFKISSRMSCGFISDCTYLNLTGEDKICNFADTITFNIQRNTGCALPAEWKYDPSLIEVISKTDSSLSVRFLRSGSMNVVASINTGCKLLSDTLTVTAINPANSISLGKDTTLCEGTTLLLNAKRGFDTYIWQDGSTDSTFKMDRPGRYHVTVSDACGSTFRDTIIVAPYTPISMTIGPDRSKCNTDTIHLTAPVGFIRYSWSNDYNISSLEGQSVIVNPSAHTSYFLKAELSPGCFAYDTVRINVYQSKPIDIGRDKSICHGDSLTLDAGESFSSYQWSNGSSNYQITIRDAGIYSVIGTTQEGCKSYDTLTVHSVWPLPVINLDKNSKLCIGDSSSLDAGSFARYLWHDGSTNRTFKLTDTGTYYVQVTDKNNCINSDTTRVTQIHPVPSAFLPLDTVICSYGILTLRPTQAFSSYIWSNGSKTASTVVDKPGQYWLQVRDQNNCTGRDSINIKPKDCMSGVFIPTAFTPNRDGKNDIFKPTVFGQVNTFGLVVYNRWGEVVYQTKDPNKGWDGKLKGVELDTGVYMWTCRYKINNEEEKGEKGTVTLIK